MVLLETSVPFLLGLIGANGIWFGALQSKWILNLLTWEDYIAVICTMFFLIEGLGNFVCGSWNRLGVLLLCCHQSEIALQLAVVYMYVVLDV